MASHGHARIIVLGLLLAAAGAGGYLLWPAGQAASVVGVVTDDGTVRLIWHDEEVAAIPVEPISTEAPLYQRPLQRPAYLDDVKSRLERPRVDDGELSTHQGKLRPSHGRFAVEAKHRPRRLERRGCGPHQRPRQASRLDAHAVGTQQFRDERAKRHRRLVVADVQSAEPAGRQ